MINDFNYLKPGSLKEALAMYGAHEDCKVICGGQSLLIVMRQGMISPEYVLDIKHVKELDYIKFDAKDGLRLGAATTHREIEKSAVIKKNYPVLVSMENKLASGAAGRDHGAGQSGIRCQRGALRAESRQGRSGGVQH